MSTGKGYAKIILFGDHFAIYGIPAIATAIDKYVKIETEEINEDDIIFDDRIFYEKISKKDEPYHISSRIFDAMFSNLNLNHVKFTVSGTAIPKIGMGYSAAFNVALARAVSEYLKLNWNDQKINEISYKGECVSHGNASGIDNACATYRSLLWFEKNKIMPFKIGAELKLVLCDSKISHNTKEIVTNVRRRAEENPDKFGKILIEAKKIVIEAKESLEEKDFKKVGILMNKNHKLLEQIGVSCLELEKLVDIALTNKALGAKITGAGGGGAVVMLCRDEEHQNFLAEKIEKENFKAMKVKLYR
ncbi:MAG: mevalonate kinase [Patescibacteria group bacterium]|nr:mevalonate kinase [Patescibacteria group bacterium]